MDNMRIYLPYRNTLPPSSGRDEKDEDGITERGVFVVNIMYYQRSIIWRKSIGKKDDKKKTKIE
jgi:hypothetical protein